MITILATDGAEEIPVTTNSFLIDGYEFGDRVLEGVIFKIQFKDDEITEVSLFNEDDAPYFQTLNQEMWIKRAKECAEYKINNSDDVEVLPEVLELYQNYIFFVERR